MAKTKEESAKTPANHEAEKNALGSVLLDNMALDELAVLNEGDFFFDQHREIYRPMNVMLANNQKVEEVSAAMRGRQITDSVRLERISKLHKKVTAAYRPNEPLLGPEGLSQRILLMI